MNKKEIKNNVLEKIENGDLYMRPRWQFVLRTILAITGILIVSFGILYLLSFVLFTLKQSGLLFVPLFGFKGIMAFVLSSPWILILLTLVFIVALEILVRKYSFGYQKPLLYTILGIVAFSLLGTYALAQARLHERLNAFAEQRTLPVLHDMYRKQDMRNIPNVHAGFIVGTTSDGYTIANRRGEELLIHITEETKFQNNTPFIIGEHVVVLGKLREGVVFAEGVRMLPPGIQIHKRDLERASSSQQIRAGRHMK